MLAALDAEVRKFLEERSRTPVPQVELAHCDQMDGGGGESYAERIDERKEIDDAG